MRQYVRMSLMVRNLLRAAEIAAEPEMAKEVTRVYSDALAPVAVTFCESHEAVLFAETTATQKRLQASKSVDSFDSICSGTRSVVLTFAPGTTLPDTLKVQRTDTDTLYAITTLVSIVKSHAGEAWADELMAGRFGTLAPKVCTALNASIAANKALAAAKQQRAGAYEPASEQYMAFKRVVRDVLGPSSVQYRRLHQRAAAAAQVEPVEEAAPDSAVLPVSKPPQAVASGPPSVKIA